MSARGQGASCSSYDLRPIQYIPEPLATGSPFVSSSSCLFCSAFLPFLSLGRAREVQGGMTPLAHLLTGLNLDRVRGGDVVELGHGLVRPKVSDARKQNLTRLEGGSGIQHGLGLL